jgi:hypothetical protein
LKEVPSQSILVSVKQKTTVLLYRAPFSHPDVKKSEVEILNHGGTIFSKRPNNKVSPTQHICGGAKDDLISCSEKLECALRYAVGEFTSLYRKQNVVLVWEIDMPNEHIAMDGAK